MPFTLKNAPSLHLSHQRPESKERLRIHWNLETNDRPANVIDYVMQKSNVFSVPLYAGKYKAMVWPNPMTFWMFLQLLGMARNLFLCLIWVKVFRRKRHLALKNGAYITQASVLHRHDFTGIKNGPFCVSSCLVAISFPWFLRCCSNNRGLWSKYEVSLVMFWGCQVSPWTSQALPKQWEWGKLLQFWLEK